MSRYNTPFEIHVHGEVPLRADVSFEQVQEALKPLWKYAGSKSLAAGAASAYEEEPGIKLDDDEARDDFVIYFVGPTPAAIMQVQRDLLVQDMIALMERHFDGSELGEVVEAVDKLFERRFDALVNSMQLGRPPRGPGGSPGGSGHGGGRKPRHLH